MLQIDYEMLPYVETCLVIQSFFLNMLWTLLLFGWLAWRRHTPLETMAGGAPSWFQWLAACIAGGISLSVAIYYFDHVYWFLGISIAYGAFMAVLNPAFALCFTMSMLMMRPWEIMANNELMLEIPRFSMFFSMAWLGFYILAVDRLRFRVTKVLIILYIYAVWVLLSTVVTPDPAQSIASVNETISRAIVLFSLIYFLIRDKFSVWALKATLVVILSCVGLISIVFYMQGYTDGGRIIAFGIFKNTNDVAAVMTMLLPLAASPLMRSSRTIISSIVALPPILIAMTVIVLAQSRAAILSLAVSAGIYFMMKYRRRAMAVISLVVMLGAPYMATKIIKRAEGDLEGSSASRKSFMISGLRMALHNPFFGVGYGQFPANFERYATDISHEYGKRTAHSTWVLALAETGPAGLLLFLSFYFLGAMKSSYLIRNHDQSWFYAAISYGVSMSFLSHTYMLFPYILVACICVAYRSIDYSIKRQALHA
jgi:hypothetical protein